MVSRTPTTGTTPAALGFSMPAEWEPHEATWLAWPHNPTDWPDKLDTIRWVYAEIVRKIAPGETIRMLVNSAAAQKQARRYLTRSGADAGRVEFLIHPTDRGWTRDSGPIFVRRGSDTAIVHFHFNAWAKYPDWEKDRRVPERAAKRVGKPLFDARVDGREFVLEGGGIDVNGRGTLLTTEECYLDPEIQVRNPGLGRAGLEKALEENLGVTNVFWLAGGVAGDDTHGHVDDITRFVGTSTIVTVVEPDTTDPNHAPLAENLARLKAARTLDGKQFTLVELPMPRPVVFRGQRLPASYANFYIANDLVLAPTFHDPSDRVALNILAEVFLDREVIGIHAVDLVWGLGTLHCMTQQQPAVL